MGSLGTSARIIIIIIRCFPCLVSPAARLVDVDGGRGDFRILSFSWARIIKILTVRYKYALQVGQNRLIVPKIPQIKLPTLTKCNSLALFRQE